MNSTNDNQLLSKDDKFITMVNYSSFENLLYVMQIACSCVDSSQEIKNCALFSFLFFFCAVFVCLFNEFSISNICVSKKILKSLGHLCIPCAIFFSLFRTLSIKNISHHHECNNSLN